MNRVSSAMLLAIRHLILSLAVAVIGIPGARAAWILAFDGGAPRWIERVAPEPAGIATEPTDPDAALARSLTTVADLQVMGPTERQRADGITGFFPNGSTLDAVAVDDGAAIVSITLPTGTEVDDLWAEWVVDVSRGLAESVEGIRSLGFRLRIAGGETEHRSPQELVPVPPAGLDAAVKPGETATVTGRLDLVPTADHPVARAQPQPVGALTGASVFLSPGHGWYYSSTLGRWATQRGNNYALLEDHSNGEAVLQYLTAYLWNAGARVYTCRERDLNTRMVIVDNGDPGHAERGAWTTETVSDSWDGNHRVAAVAATETATARFTPDIPEAGHYAVYAWYRHAVSGTTTTDARIEIRHTGGTTVWTQDQNHDGHTWKYIGTYWFDAGSDIDAGSVLITNEGSTPGTRVVADAVRFGGGMGDLPDDDSGTTSGFPRWEESGRYYAGYMGRPGWTSYGTVWAMPRYADWEAEPWEAGKCVYVSWHSNAGGGGTGTGTETYAYSSAGWNGAFDGVAGGDKLRNYIHNEVVADLRSGWDAGWVNRGTKTANFGELNPSNNDEMPAALIEVAFHDNPSDVEDLLDPRFRRIVARAVAQGIVKFYANEVTGFSNSTLAPEPPTHLRVGNLGGGEMIVAWNAPPSNSGNGLLGDPATGYRVYRSPNGKGFDNGVEVTGTSTVLSGLTEGETIYLRIAAVNGGGESLPTETLGVRVAGASGARVLVVNGFDRLDGSANIMEDDPYDTDDLSRGYRWLMNTYDYSIAHAAALAAHEVAFDSCANEAVIAGQVNLGNYDAVVWILGEESIADSTFDTTEQAKVTAYLNDGGRLFVSGSEIGWDLEHGGNGVAFYRDVLRGDYLTDDAGVHEVSGAAGSIFAGIGAFAFDDGTEIYHVDWPDTVGAVNGSTICMRYSASGSPGAGVQYIGGDPDRRVVMLGFPFEAILDPSVRVELMGRALEFLGVGGGLPDGIAVY